MEDEPALFIQPDRDIVFAKNGRILIIQNTEGRIYTIFEVVRINGRLYYRKFTTNDFSLFMGVFTN